MHDTHRSKPELIHEITGLRKQVLDLKEAMTARRRVEDALRETETTLRRLSDGAPVGLGLFDLKGTLLAANRRFALMLGYDSAADLLSIAGVLGVFASAEEQSLTLGASRDIGSFPRRALFRLKSGCRRQHPVLASRCADPEHGAITLAILDSDPALIGPPFQSPSA